MFFYCEENLETMSRKKPIIGRPSEWPNVSWCIGVMKEILCHDRKWQLTEEGINIQAKKENDVMVKKWRNGVMRKAWLKEMTMTDVSDDSGL